MTLLPMVSILFYLKGKQQQQQPGSGRLDTRPQRTNNQGPRDDKENNTQRPKTGGEEGISTYSQMLSLLFKYHLIK